MNMSPADSADFWSSWQLAPAVSIPLAILAFLYLGQSLLGPRFENRQLTFFFLGIASIALVTLSPVGVRSSALFWCHMIQHITLMMVSGPLFVLATPPSFKLKNPVVEILSKPVVSWILYATLMIGVHLPTPHLIMMRNPWIHTYVEVPTYVAIAYLFYFNLLGRKTNDRRISPAFAVISLFLMMVPETLTGFFIYAAPHSLYQNMYSLNDQRRGGSIMWSGGMIIDALWMALAVHHWFKSEELKALEVDKGAESVAT